MSIRVLLVDDHQIVREGIRNVLAAQPDFEVVAEAEDGQTGMKLAQKLKPNVVVMDIAMSSLNGIEATRQLVTLIPGIKIIALSMYSDRRFVRGMLRAGATGYLLKDCAMDDLVKAIRAVTANQTFMSPRIADVVVKNHIQFLKKSDFSAFSVLTPRECEILQLLAEGKATRDIAAKLSLSVKTIETHRQQIMEKLSIYSVAELTKYAIREGLTSLEG